MCFDAYLRVGLYNLFTMHDVIDVYRGGQKKGQDQFCSK